MLKRKLFILLVAVVAVVCLAVVGCAPEAAAPPEEEEEAPPEEEEEEEAPPAAPEAKVYKWKWQDNSGPGTTQLLCLEDLVARVKAASEGRLDITVVPEGTVVPRVESTAAVRDGVLNVATNDPSVDVGRLGPITYLCGAPGVPAGPSSMEDVAFAYKGGGIEVYNEVWKDWAYVVGVQPGAAELFAHSNKPLATAKDFKGLKFRTAGMWAELLKPYGAAVVMIAAGELYSSVERGVLDAFELGPPSFNWPYGFHEVCQYIGLPGIQSPGYTKPVWVNKKSWDELPADLKELFQHEIMAMALDTLLRQQIDDAAALEKYRDYGTTIFYVEDDFQAEIAKNSRALIEKFAVEDPAFRELWEKEQAFFKTWRAITGIIPKYTIFD